MTDKIKGLLAVLDLPEDEQWGFLISYPGIQKMCGDQLDAFCQSNFKRRVLADLAFRLRDEAIKSIGPEAYDVLALTETLIEDRLNFRQYKWIQHIDGWKYCAQPIHWIIAALIAGLAKEQT